MGPEDKDAGDLDNSHVSNHHVEGTYDHPITQRGYDGEGGTFHAFTDVDSNGDVGESGFDD